MPAPDLGEFQKAQSQHLSSRKGKEPAWLWNVRQNSLKNFVSKGLPSVKEESWRNVPVSEFTEALASGPLAPAPIGQDFKPAVASTEDWHHLVFLNGRYAPQLSHGLRLPEGVLILSLKDAIAKSPDLLEPHLFQSGSENLTSFVSLNDSSFEDGAFIRISRNALPSKPIHLCYVSTSDQNSMPIHPRNLIVVESGAQVSIVESYVGTRDGSYFNNPVTEIFLRPGAALHHFRLQEESSSARHVSHLRAQLQRDSQFHSYVMTLSGALVRNDMHVHLKEPGSQCYLNGLYILDGKQFADNHTYVHHESPNCISREFYKGILDGDSHSIFDGTVFVHPHAQKTDAGQLNRNLVLSDRAVANSVPRLEIEADDVKCSHGSSIGSLDEASTFYLRARGLSEEDARNLLTYAFANEIVDMIPIRGLKGYVHKKISSLIAETECFGVIP